MTGETNISRDFLDLAAGRLTPEGRERLIRALDDPESDVHRLVEGLRTQTEDVLEEDDWWDTMMEQSRQQRRWSNDQGGSEQPDI